MNKTQTVYFDEECVFTDEGKAGVVKQNNGYKFSIVGAVLFSDKDNWVYGRYLRKNLLTRENYLHTITWEQLKKNTQIIYYNNISMMFIIISNTKNFFIN